MGRPATKPSRLKDGFYLEVKSPGDSGILLRRDTMEQLLAAADSYSKSKNVIILGELKDNKWIDIAS